MTQKEKKQRFILMRAKGHSYSDIIAELAISKSTCSTWEQELKEQIAELESEELAELKARYKMTRAGHISKLADTLDRIDTAIESADFSAVPVDKLLRVKLEYEEKLRAELKTDGDQNRTPLYTAEQIARETQGVYERLKAGEITPQTAKIQLCLLQGIDHSKAIVDNDFLINPNFSKNGGAENLGA